MARDLKNKFVPFKPIKRIEKTIAQLGWQLSRCLSNGCGDYELDRYLQKQHPDLWAEIKALLKFAGLMVYRESGDL